MLCIGRCKHKAVRWDKLQNSSIYLNQLDSAKLCLSIKSSKNNYTETQMANRTRLIGEVSSAVPTPALSWVAMKLLLPLWREKRGK